VEARIRTRLHVWASAAFIAIALKGSTAWPQGFDQTAGDQKSAIPPRLAWTKVSIDLPSSPALFPPGEGADIANGQCLICHSAEMVLLQPPFTKEGWRGEINKMRSAFGALLPEDQVEALAQYLHAINGDQGCSSCKDLDVRQGS
jgi:mono/diheme cytochrome c family protein